MNIQKQIRKISPKRTMKRYQDRKSVQGEMTTPWQRKRRRNTEDGII